MEEIEIELKKDENGYLREKNHSNLWHRKIAYHKVYLKNKEKYPLPFSEYEIHHKDGNKNNNNPENLEVLTPEEHIDRHLEKENDYEGYYYLISLKSGLSFEEIDRLVKKKMLKFNGLIDKQGALKIIDAELGVFTK